MIPTQRSILNAIPICSIGSVNQLTFVRWLANWAKNNQCGKMVTESKLEDICNIDGPNGSSSTVSLLKYHDGASYTGKTGERRMAEVIHYRITGGGHSWPVLQAERATSIAATEEHYGKQLAEFAGAVNSDISASAEIWKFFNRHELAVVPEK